ncbi:MAG: type II toxin-antitoxin system RelE family toxin [bacterium]
MASYRLFIKPSAVKELESIPRENRQRVAGRIHRLSADPRPTGAEKLSALERYRIRQGDYRVVYAIDDRGKTVTVFKVGHRREVYREE